MTSGGFDLASARGNGGFPATTAVTAIDGEDQPLPDDGQQAYEAPFAPPPPDRDNAQRLIRWADPTQTLNVAKEILEDREAFPDG